MSTTDPPPPLEEDSVSIISFDDGLYLEGDYALPGSDIRIQRWLSQQCRFALEVNSREKELDSAPDPHQHRLGPYALGGPGELLSSVLMKQSTSTVSEEAALRADSPLLGFGGKEVEVEDDGDERTLMDPLHFPSPTYVRDLPGDSINKKHSPHSSHSSNTSSSVPPPPPAAAAHARSQSTSSSPRKISLALSPLSRRPSLFRQPSLPLLGELDDEQSVTTTQVQPQAISPPPIIPQAGRSRAQSNASISSFHLPTSMQFQSTLPAIHSPPPTTPTSPPPTPRRHSRMPNTPPVSSTLASLSFGADDDHVDVRPLTSPIPRPHSQLHGPSLHHHSTTTHRHQPPPSSQKIPRALSRSSSTLSLSLLANNPNNRNAVYIDDPLIDIKSGDLVDDDDLVTPVVAPADGGEGLGLGVDSPMPEGHRLLQVGSEEASQRHHHHTPPIPHSAPPYVTSGVYYNAIGSSSQVYLGTASVPGTSAKRPTRPPPAPPLIIEGEDESGGLGGIGVIDEDAPWSGRGVVGTADADEETSDIIRTESDFSSELHDTDDTDEGGDKLKRFTSRWSLTSSVDENTPSPGASGVNSNSGGVVSAFGVGGGSTGLFGSRKRRSVGGEKERLIDKERSIDKEKEKGGEKENKEKSGDKKRGRLVSFISRISSNIASPPSSQNPGPSSPYAYEVFEMNTGPASPYHTGGLGFWFSDVVAPPPPVLPPIRNMVTGKKEKNKKKGKEVVGEELAEKEKARGEKQVDDKEGNDKPKENDKPPPLIETVEVVPASISVHVMADGRADAGASADSTMVESKATQKSQLKVDTTTYGQVPVQQLTVPPQFGQTSKSIPNHIISSPLSSSPLPLSPSPDPQSQSQYLTHASSSSKGLKNIASPIMKAFSEGFVGAGPALDFMAARSGSGSIVVGGESGAGAGTGRVRSSSAADLLGRSSAGSVGGGTGYFDLYQHRQHLHRQAPGGSSQVQARQQQGQHQQQQGYQQQYEDEQHQYRQRSQSHPLQYQPQSELHQPPRQSPANPSVTDDYYGSVLGGTSSSRPPAATATPAFDVADVTNSHRPGLVKKSASTPMLDTGGPSGVVGGGGYEYGLSVANSDLPSSPVLFAAIPANYDEDDDEDEFDDDEDEDEDYGVEAPHGQWRGGGVGLAYDIDRERGTEYNKRWEMEQQSQYVDEHSTSATNATPRASTDTPPTSFIAPSITRRSGSISNIVGTQTTQEQRQLLMQGVDNRQRLRSVTSLGNISVVGAVAPTPTPMMKNGNGSSKGLRGFVERMKFTTTATNSASSSSSSSPTIPQMAFTAAAVATTATSSNTSSPLLAHSPTSFVMGSITGGGGGGSPFLNVNDGLFGPEQQKKRKKQPKRKLVINGVSMDDVKGYEAVKAWCESFGEVREMKRTANGHLHVDFRKASVAETVCRLKTQVFIKGAGSVSLSWYTKDRH